MAPGHSRTPPPGRLVGRAPGHGEGPPFPGLGERRPSGRAGGSSVREDGRRRSAGPSPASSRPLRYRSSARR
ncbi:hypothetical protein EW053_11380 [Streptomyces sp. IB2014 016-6]|nr:hypothetical protein EW053_11380 [Streptomyces sp. IB2014 016-6]